MEYETGTYIGKAAFNSEDFQNRQCRTLRDRSLPGGCEINDLNTDSVMEAALASANIIPALSDSTPVHTGFATGGARRET